MASVLTAVLLYLTQLRSLPGYLPGVALFTLLAAGLVKCALPTFYSHDPRAVVIDEVVGYLVAALFIEPLTLVNSIILVTLFRLFDITKIGGLKKLEYLPGVKGIILDDIGAGVYAGALTYAVLKALAAISL